MGRYSGDFVTDGFQRLATIVRIGTLHKARILALSVVALLSACERATGARSQSEVVAGPAQRAALWRETAISMLNQGRCADVRWVLQAVPAGQVNEDWYGLKAMGEAACWAHSHASADREAAFKAIDQGLKRYPDSAALVSEKGALFETFGNLAEAMPLYNAAKVKAAENLKKNPRSRTDWGVLNRMSKRLHLPPPALLPNDAVAIEPSSDLVEGRPAWQAEASRLIATGNWRDAARPITTLPTPMTLPAI